MSRVGSLGLNQDQIDAIKADKKILNFIEDPYGPSRLEVSAHAAFLKSLPHPFEDTIEGVSFDGQPTPLSCISLVARLGLLDHFAVLFDRATTEDKIKILTSDDCAIFSSFLQHAPGRSNKVIRSFHVMAHKLDKELKTPKTEVSFFKK